MGPEDLFERELDILREGMEMVSRKSDTANEWFLCYEKLLKEFEKVVGQSLRLVKIGDVMQHKLNAVTAELQVEVERRKRTEAEKEQVIEELKTALAKVNQLSGLLPICSSCKKIRDDKGYWNQIEAYIRDHSEAQFTHSICPECSRRLYPELFRED